MNAVIRDVRYMRERKRVPIGQLLPSEGLTLKVNLNATSAMHVLRMLLNREYLRNHSHYEGRIER